MPFSILLPLSSIHQLLPLLFSNNGKEVWHHLIVVPDYRVKKASGSAGTMVTVLHLKHEMQKQDSVQNVHKGEGTPPVGKHVAVTEAHLKRLINLISIHD